MKAILEFNLPEDREEHEEAVNAWKVTLAVWDYSQWLRGLYKHGETYTIDTEEARQKLFDIWNKYNLNTDML